MTTMIERLLARMAAYRDGLEAKLLIGSDVDVGPSSFASIDGESSVTVLMAAAAADNAAKAAARLRALHEPALQQKSAQESAGTSQNPTVIDAEFTEIPVGEGPNDNT